MLPLFSTPLGKGFAIAGALMLAGCGFQPLYGGPGYAGLPGVEIETGQSRIDYAMRDALRDYLGAGAGTDRLVIRSETRIRPLGVSAAGNAARYALELTSVFVLYDASGAVLSEGEIRETAQYDTGSDPYAQLASEADAETRVARMAAERILNRVAVALRRSEAGLEP